MASGAEQRYWETKMPVLYEERDIGPFLNRVSHERIGPCSNVGFLAKREQRACGWVSPVRRSFLCARWQTWLALNIALWAIAFILAPVLVLRDVTCQARRAASHAL